MTRDRFTVPADHPCLAGHFPGRPIVPAVVMLDAVFAAVRAHYSRRVARLLRCKFSRPLVPGASCEIELEDGGGNEIRFRCIDDSGLLARGRLELASIPND